MTSVQAEQGGTSSEQGQGVGVGIKPPLGGLFPRPGTSAAGDPRWFVVRTNPNCDEKAVQSIGRTGLEARSLIWRKEFIHNRTKKPIWKSKRLLVGYVFVRLPSIEDSSVVRGCDGVAKFLNHLGRPLSITSDEMTRLIGYEAAEEFQPLELSDITRPVFSVGDTILISEDHHWFGGAAAKVVAVHGRSEATVSLVGHAASHPLRIAVDKLNHAS
jgi:transcription antitermination factor NusG